MKQAYQKIGANLPDVLARLMPRLFSMSVPRETAATCADCCMLGEAPGDRGDSLYFLPEVKCCTYFPSMPNFLVGGLLQDESPESAEGRRRVETRIANNSGIDPLGVCKPESHSLLYNAAARHVFGRSRVLRCPYFDVESGHCTVRPWWISICHTWFCKYVAGSDGWHFWMAVRRYMTAVETVLAQYTASELGLAITPQTEETGPAAIRPDQLDDVASPAGIRSSKWGKWTGREAAFYRRAYELVSRLTARDLERLMGFSGVRLLADIRRCRLEMMKTKVPSILKRASDLKVTKLDQDTYLLGAYSIYDPVCVTKTIYDLLDEFDGVRTTSAILTGRRKQNLPVPAPDLLLGLYRASVLMDTCRQED